MAGAQVTEQAERIGQAGQAPTFAPGARIEVRDTEWMVRTCTPAADGDVKITAVGVSEIVRDEDAIFFANIDHPRQLRPEDTELVPDGSSGFARSRLFLEAVLRRTPLPQSETGLALPDRFLLDPLTYQQRPAELALKGLRPRILIADVVGLGKTLEIGLLLAELIRRGRGERILVVTPQQVLEQFQRELWTRFSIPLVRLDSVGLERVQREIPAGRNPFLYFKRVIISVDTLKNQGRYGQHLQNMHWDAVVIDESHNVIKEGNQRNKLARLLAEHTDALLLASATPHNGDEKSFAQLISLLDPAAIADPGRYASKDIEHLYLRRTKVSPEVRDKIGAKWPERGPSVALRCRATGKEQRILEEFTQVWLRGKERLCGPVTSRERRLFPWTLFKTFMSSHVALETTAARRLANMTEKDRPGVLKAGEDAREFAALTDLLALVRAMKDKDSAKLAALVDELQKIDVRRHRVVVFSESVPTLNWLATVVPKELKLKPDQVQVMHGGLNDQQQQGIVEDFALDTSKVRVLFTGDVASEGVNLHQQCHHLIHYDVPWSLIRIEQRNGRIDRYGQRHRPEFRAILLESQHQPSEDPEDEGRIVDDTTVSIKLLAKEEKAHRALGTAERDAGAHTSEAEEDRLILDMFDGKTVEESYEQAAAGDDFGWLTGPVGDGDFQEEPPRAPVPRLFASTEEFVREALRTVTPDLRVDHEDELLVFEPPGDLAHRLHALPASYLRMHKVKERMKVTFDRGLALENLERARTSKTLWPDIAYLSDLHPMVEWLVDKVQVQLMRQQAPVLRAPGVAEPTFLVQGIYSNALGQPTVVEWMAVSGLPHDPVIGKMEDFIAATGIGPGLSNPLIDPDLDRLGKLITPAVDAARAHLEKRRSAYDARVAESLEPTADRLENWEQTSLVGLPDDWRGAARRKEVTRTAQEQRRLFTRMRTTGDPLLRILAAVEGI